MNLKEKNYRSNKNLTSTLQQAIVSTSYDEPLKTISTNVLGTANIDILKTVNHECIAVIVTSDKCYENVEWPWA